MFHPQNVLVISGYNTPSDLHAKAGTFSGARMAGSTRFVGGIRAALVTSAAQKVAIRCSDAMSSTTLQCTQLEFEGHVWEQLRTYQLMLLVLHPAQLFSRKNFAVHTSCLFLWIMMVESPAFLAEVAHNMSPLFLDPPQKAERQGIPKKLWRSQSFGGYNKSCQVLLFILSPSGYNWSSGCSSPNILVSGSLVEIRDHNSVFAQWCDLIWVLIWPF